MFSYAYKGSKKNKKIKGSASLQVCKLQPIVLSHISFTSVIHYLCV